MVKDIYTKVFKKEFTLCICPLQSIWGNSWRKIHSYVVNKDNLTTDLKDAKLSPHTMHIGLPYQWFRRRVYSL